MTIFDKEPDSAETLNDKDQINVDKESDLFEFEPDPDVAPEVVEQFPEAPPATEPEPEPEAPRPIGNAWADVEGCKNCGREKPKSAERCPWCGVTK